MSVEHLIAIALAAAVAAAAWYLIVGRVLRRQALLRQLVPESGGPRSAPREPALVSDPLLVAESTLSGTADYVSSLRELVAQHRVLLAASQRQARTADMVERAQRRAGAVALRIEALRQAWLFPRLRTALAARRLQIAETMRDAAQSAADHAGRAVEQARDALRARESIVDAERPRISDGVEAAWIDRDKLLVMFRRNASPKAIKRLLERYGLDAVAVIPRLSLYTVRLPPLPTDVTDATAAARLHALVDLLSGERIVRLAVQNVVLGGAMAAEPVPGTAAAVAVAAPLALARFPEAWQFNESRGAKDRVEVGVLDVGFLDDQDDLKVKPLDNMTNQPDPHGTAVAAIIAAQPGNGIGIDGAAPFAHLIGAAAKGAIYDEFASLLAKMLKHEPRLRVINASVSYNWPSKSVVPTKSSDAQSIVAKQGIIVRELMAAAKTTIVVAAAGNDCHNKQNCHAPAVWASPYNWAALAPAAPDQGSPSPNIIVVEGLDATGTDRLPMTNRGGTIRAIGEGVPTLRDANGAVTHMDGTSAAAPFVTATIALMLQVNPSISVRKILESLGIGSGVGDAAPKLDAFDAVQKSVS